MSSIKRRVAALRSARRSGQQPFCCVPECLAARSPCDDLVHGVANSPDGRWVAAAHTDQYGGPGAARDTVYRERLDRSKDGDRTRSRSCSSRRMPQSVVPEA